MSTETQDVIISDLPDLADAPLDAGLGIDDAEYARIMRRIGAGDDGAGPGVCAFNSSI